MSGSRNRARRYALLALYQWQLGRQSIAEIVQHFYNDELWIEAIDRGLAGYTDDDPLPKQHRFDVQLFDGLVRGVVEHIEEIDDYLKQFLNRSLSSIDPVECSILRLAGYELLHSQHLPTAVILNEAIELTKTFGAEQGHRFINGVLDKAAQQRTITIV